MKSRNLLISAICILALVSIANPQEEPEDLYVQAKNAIENNDCKSTIKLLSTYLTKVTPSKEKIDSIFSVIGWCFIYLDKGQIHHQIHGYTGPDRSYFEETAFGAEMKKHKKQLLNK